MRKIEVELSGADCDALQARQIELEGKKELYMACLSSTYNIPVYKVDELEKSYLDSFGEYNILKDYIQEKYMPEPNAESWSVIFNKGTIVFDYLD